MTTFDPGPPGDARLEPAGNKTPEPGGNKTPEPGGKGTPEPSGGETPEPAGPLWTLIFIRELRQPPERVWAALTDPEELDQWAPFAAATTLAKPGDTTLTMVDGEERVDLPATVIHAEAPTLLEYSWGDDLLRWELEPAGGGTRLTLRHTLATTGIEAMVAAGWHLCVAVLQRLLDGEPVGVIRGSAALDRGFEQLRAAYEERFGL